MANNTQIMTVSVPKVLCEFIESAEISPSAIIQEALIEKKQLWDAANKEKIKLLRNIQGFQDLIQEYVSFLETKNLIDEFYKWRNEKKKAFNGSNAIL